MKKSSGRAADMWRIKRTAARKPSGEGCTAPGFTRHVEQAVHQSGNDIRAAVKRAGGTCGSKAGQ